MASVGLTKHWFSISICVTWLFTSTIAMSTGKTVGNLKVGLVLPLTGKMSAFGQEIKAGFEIGLRTYLEEAKKSPKDIGVFDVDSEDKNNSKKNLGQDLCKKKRVSIIVGGLSAPESNRLSDIAKSYNKIFFSLMAKEMPELHERKNTYQLSSSHRWQAEVAAQHIAKNIDPPITAVILPSQMDEKTRRVVASFKKTLSNNSQTKIIETTLESSRDQQPENQNSPADNIVKTEKDSEPLANTDNKAAAANDHIIRLAKMIKDSKAGVAFFPHSWGDSKPILDSLERIGYRGKAVGLEYWSSRSAHKGLMKLQKIQPYYITHFNPRLLPRNFVNSFKEANKRLPSALAAVGFEAAVLVAHIYVTAESTRTTPLVQKLKSLNVKGMHSLLNVGRDKSIERAMIAATPKANRDLLIVPENLQPE